MPAPSTRALRTALDRLRADCEQLDDPARVPIGIHLSIVATQLGLIDEAIAEHERRQAEAPEAGQP